MNAFDWAMRATIHGYAVLVVDPLTQRNVTENCPGPVRRDAGEHEATTMLIPDRGIDEATKAMSKTLTARSCCLGRLATSP
jgi:hypothetical protein